MGADSDVIGLAYDYSKKAVESGNLELAVYFLEIFCDLTEDQKSLRLLETLKQQLSTDNK